jgi:DNA-binding Lrp family transcriptional regulator
MIGPRTIPSPAWDQPLVREVAGLSLRFVLDISRISRGDGDIIGPLLMTAILDANQAIIHRHPELNRLYGDARTALPDDLRRPISINALSKSLRLPFETVRRRIVGWAEAGVCVRAAAGVYVPQAVVTSPAYLAVQAARVARLRAMHADLVGVGFIRPSPAGGLAQAGVRAADRALGQYMLRTCDQLIRLAANPVNGFVFLGLCVARSGGALWGPRRPAPVAAVAGELGMPDETVRRRLLALRELGLAAHRPRGWLPAAEARAWPQLGGVLAYNEADLRRLFARLDDLGAPGAICA